MRALRTSGDTLTGSRLMSSYNHDTSEDNVREDMDEKQKETYLERLGIPIPHFLDGRRLAKMVR